MVDSLTKQKEDMKISDPEMLKHLDLKYKNEIIRSMEWLKKKIQSLDNLFL